MSNKEFDVMKRSNEELVLEIQRGNTAAKNDLFDALRGWLYQVCGRYKHFAKSKGYELDDLISWAWFGIERAIFSYDPERGLKFITYTKYNILNAVREGLGLRGKKELQTLSLDKPLSDMEEDFTMHDTIEDEQASKQFRTAEDRELARWLWGRVDRLDERKAYVLRERFQRGESLEKIGAKLGVTISAVRQTEGNALRELRKDRELIAYYREMAYIHVGVNSFNSTWTSATELAVLKRAEILQEMRSMLADAEREKHKIQS